MHYDRARAEAADLVGGVVLEAGGLQAEAEHAGCGDQAGAGAGIEHGVQRGSVHHYRQDRSVARRKGHRQGAIGTRPRQKAAGAILYLVERQPMAGAVEIQVEWREEVAAKQPVDVEVADAGAREDADRQAGVAGEGAADQRDTSQCQAARIGVGAAVDAADPA